MTKKKKKKRKKQGTLEKCLVPGLENGKHKMSLKHLTVPKARHCSKHDRDMVKGHKICPALL